MIELAVFLGSGIALGVFTGLLPGLHPNTVIFGTLPFYFSTTISFQGYMIFIIGMSVSHTFHDFLPAIYLGAPEAETALSTLPGGRMALKGRGQQAFAYSVYGGLVSVFLLLFLAPVLLWGLEAIYSSFSTVIPYALLFFLSFILFRSEEIRKSFTVAALSSALGIISFRMAVNQHYVLVPVFAGLFAVPSLLHAHRTEFKIPEQKPPFVRKKAAFQGGAVGVLAGLLAGTVPGIGGAVSTTFLSPLLEREEQFVAALGGVNTSDILVSFLTVYILGKARSGAAVAALSLNRLYPSAMLLMAGAAVFSVAVSAAVSVKTSGYFLATVQKIRLERLLLGVVSFIVGVTVLLTGLPGLLVLLTASMIGFAAQVSGHRANCMAVLIVPAMLASTGIFI